MPELTIRTLMGQASACSSPTGLAHRHRPWDLTPGPHATQQLVLHVDAITTYRHYQTSPQPAALLWAVSFPAVCSWLAHYILPASLNSPWHPLLALEGPNLRSSPVFLGLSGTHAPLAALLIGEMSGP